MDSLLPRENSDDIVAASKISASPVFATARPLRDSSREIKRSWWLALSALALLVIVGLLVYPNDLLVSDWIVTIGNLPGDMRRVLALSELVAHGSGVLVLLGVTWLIAPHLRIYLPRVACCAFVAGLVANGVKLIHARFRPLACPPDIETVQSTWQGWLPGSSEAFAMPYGYAYQSFPSAHTATAVGFAIGLAWLFPKGRVLFFAIAILAGLQRIAFLAHWPSDVVFGAAIGVFFGSCFTLKGTLGNALLDRLERYLMFAGNTPIHRTPIKGLPDQDLTTEDTNPATPATRRVA